MIDYTRTVYPTTCTCCCCCLLYYDDPQLLSVVVVVHEMMEESRVHPRYLYRIIAVEQIARLHLMLFFINPF